MYGRNILSSPFAGFNIILRQRLRDNYPAGLKHAGTPSIVILPLLDYTQN
jgi:hypothetical protein